MGLVDNVSTKNEIILSQTMIWGNNGLFWEKWPNIFDSIFSGNLNNFYQCTLFSYFLALIGSWQKNFLRYIKRAKEKYYNGKSRI